MKKTESVLNEQSIQEWKAKWGKIYKSTIDGEEYIWRKLKRKEYVAIMAKVAEPGTESSRLYERQDEITKLVVLYPSNIEDLIESSAGLASTISDEVIIKSGFDISSTEEL